MFFSKRCRIHLKFSIKIQSMSVKKGLTCKNLVKDLKILINCTGLSKFQNLTNEM